ncbi:MAG: cytochrome c-type biogenesis protein CcmH [Rhizobiaceae bacterium]
MVHRIAAACLLFAAACVPAYAVLPSEVLDDPALEERARSISAELRCLVCQNQSIDDSDADLARDLRVLVRERLVAGDTDEQVFSFVVSRYGEFVLLKPSFSLQNALLWAAPFALLLIGGMVLVVSIRNRQQTRSAGLSENEQAELDKILQGGDRKS